MVKEIKSYLPSSKYSLKAPNSMTAKGITLHNTYNDAAAQSEINYMKNNSSSTGFHTAIDNKSIVHGIPFNRNAYHAGDGVNGYGNRNHIGIEICYSLSGGAKYDEGETNAIKYTAKLLKSKGWGINKVKKHQDWSGKNCPHRILARSRGWQGIISAIQSELDKLGGKKESVTVKPRPKPNKKPAKSVGSVVDYLNAKGINSSFSNRKKLAAKHGISNYKGTASQNTTLLNKLKSGSKPSGKPKVTGSVVDYLKSKKIDSSFANRKKLAAKHGIKSYQGTEAQNSALLSKIIGGSKPTSKPTTKKANLTVDGYAGKATIKAEQRYHGTPVDGIISRPSVMIKKRQAILGEKEDGFEGPLTIKAEQRRRGTPVDGIISKPSVMIKERQKALNNGTF